MSPGTLEARGILFEQESKIPLLALRHPPTQKAVQPQAVPRGETVKASQYLGSHGKDWRQDLEKLTELLQTQLMSAFRWKAIPLPAQNARLPRGTGSLAELEATPAPAQNTRLPRGTGSLAELEATPAPAQNTRPPRDTGSPAELEVTPCRPRTLAFPEVQAAQLSWRPHPRRPRTLAFPEVQAAWLSWRSPPAGPERSPSPRYRQSG
ncbi:hypothetical protein KIL84_013209 [Mauremys mutica]|uniref:Uncharacterized protein n=1 Tax=Mauremys mutica TaxID=74926 RepID=A0A9D3WV27_9SAUR|nr:hypothetical protein KIL84_013209 [Mauremys mutica]